MNNKGQALVLFVLLLPIFFLTFALIFDSSLIVQEHTKLKNIAKDAINNVDKNINIDDVKLIIEKNDKEIKIINISKNEVHLKKYIESYFGKIVGHDIYELETHYEFYKKNNTLIIKEKGK